MSLKNSTETSLGLLYGVAEINQRRWLEESGHWLENVDQTHLVLASGKTVLQKKSGEHFWKR